MRETRLSVLARAIILSTLLLISPAAANNSPAGWGHSSAQPRGNAITVPSGLMLNQPFPGITIFDEKCRTGDKKVKRGSGGAVLICFSITNSSDSLGAPEIIEFILPAGTVFISQDDEYQHGILVIGERFVVAPGQTLKVPLYLYCMNASREQSTPVSRYILGPVTQLAAFKQLARLIEGKKVPTTSGAINAAIDDIQAGHAALQPVTLSLLDAEMAHWPDLP